MEAGQFEAKILSRTIHEDDSMSLFLDVRGLDETVDLLSLRLEPELEIWNVVSHPEDRKHHALELRTPIDPELNKNSLVTLHFNKFKP